MCGIAGIVSLTGRHGPPERDALLRMAAALAHRGPDEAGLYRDARAGLAHTRLSIIDLGTGQQPMANEDGTLWVVFNGEIFNYVELRPELERLGHRFRTQSDTEVLLHAYEAWGDAAFERMNGQWAVALWDARRHRLVLSRDRHGVRPLFLCERDGVLTFASEVKAIFASSDAIPRAFDPLGLDETFTFWSVVPPRGVFAGIAELEPGHVRTYEDGAVKDRAYDTPVFAGDARDEAGFRGTIGEAAEAVREAITRATRLRMLRADVPVGSYLSGGLDSALVAVLGREAATGAFHTFSVRFDDGEYDETPYQREMAGRLGSDHAEIVVTRRDISAAFPDVVYHAERPVLRTAPAPLYLLSQLVRSRGIKVVLTGEGADEMFAGYDLFREGKARRFWARAPASRLRPLALERLYPYLQRSPVAQRELARHFFGRDLARASEPGFAHGPRWHTTSALKRLFTAEQRDAVRGYDAVGALVASMPPAFATWGPLQQDQYLEIRTLLTGYLLSSQGDRMLMGHSVEGRFPFLDRDVVALAHSLPASYKLKVLDEKHVLKRASEGLVPDVIRRRKKQPYRAPDALAFTGGATPDYADDLLASGSVASAGVFQPAAVAQLWAKCRGRGAGGQFSNADNMALVGVLSTQLLHAQFIARRPVAARRVVLQTDVDRVAGVEQAGPILR